MDNFIPDFMYTVGYTAIIIIMVIFVAKAILCKRKATYIACLFIPILLFSIIHQKQQDQEAEEKILNIKN